VKYLGWKFLAGYIVMFAVVTVSYKEQNRVPPRREFLPARLAFQIPDLLIHAVPAIPDQTENKLQMTFVISLL
jgi:hypothetical protein